MSSTNSAIKGRAFGDRVLLALVILLAAVMVAPALYVIALSLKDNKDIFFFNDYYLITFCLRFKYFVHDFI